MSVIMLECDRCQIRIFTPARRNHQARRWVQFKGWITKPSKRDNRILQDICPGCQHETT